ncbi:MAG: PepSY-like domain-containing protein [Phaeodactylibacter xiamenensis]|uniref:Putative beta-lactamase-inhibitor-like PepSY-like domain-containing protein n=1 Tax=Phaeodactylibacter xiamenensis TaxID=1524460 RepID=A0A098SAM4_9BACT|nr:PepSY-like domain-containing protein [Phaeodactylibacter xiamenensis]KGE88688.1 hypothetical protein IX84_08465 [Phaeodactylibacter xiamenensis]MCR9051961.1 PepSY-like domain-containing protein [bacterium]
MKNLMFGALALITALTLGSCNLLDDNSSPGGNPFSTVFNPDAVFSPCDDGVDASYSDLPAAAQDYIQANFANWEVDDVDRYLENGDVRFGVELDSLNLEYELLFDANGSLISSGPDDDDTYISISDLPQEVLDYLEAEFPGMAIDEVSIDVEYGLEFFEVELYDNLEVYFSIDGIFVCSENSDGNDDDGNDDDNGNDDDDDDDNGNDDDDDDDDDQVNNLPASVTEFINSNYPGYHIDEAYTEEFCNNTNILEVEIEMGSQDIDLYFDLNGNFLFEGDDISTSSLPAAVVATLNAEYPGYHIDDAEILTLPDGSIQYWVEVENGNDNDEDEDDVVLTADGNIICSFED